MKKFKYLLGISPHGAYPTSSRASTGEHSETAVIAVALPHDVAAFVRLHRSAEDGRRGPSSTFAVPHSRHARHGG